MNEVEYILRIVLKARDELAGALANARRELRLFANAAESDKGKIDALNTSMETLETNAKNITDKFREWRAVLQGTDSENAKTTKSFAQLNKELEESTKSTVKASKAQQDMLKSCVDLENTVNKLNADFKNDKVSRRDYADDLNRIAKEYDKLLGKSAIGSELSAALREAANTAREQSKIIIAEEEKQTKAIEAAEKRRVAMVKLANAQIAKDIEAQIKKEEDDRKAHERFLADLEKRRVAMVKLGNAQVAKEIEQQIADEERSRKDHEKVLADIEKSRVRNVKIANDQIAREIDQQIADEKRAADERIKNIERTAAAQQAEARAEAIRGRIAGRRRPGGKLEAVDIAEAQATVQALRRVAGQFDDTSREARALRGEAEKLSGSLRQVRQESARSGNIFARFGSYMDKNRDSVASLDNTLRGMGWLIAAGFAQQLITVLGGVGGAFTAVAASAAQAGIAIGGTFVAGIAQAMPAIGLLAGALSRVGSVMDVVKQAQTAQQAAAVQGAGASRRVADATDAITNANDGLISANQGLENANRALADAQRDLVDANNDVREARRDAKDDLEDLINAERRADLAARGAVLSQKEAQEQLRLAIQSGDVEALARAELGVLEAQADAEEKIAAARRARRDSARAQRGGVEGMEGVQDAKRQAEEAERGVADARRGIENAERAVTRASRGIQTARRNASEAAAGTQTAAATLNYLLAQLSPAERRLYQALTNIQEAYKKTYRPITDLIIDSFTRSVKGVQRIMLMPEVISMARRTAQQIARQLNRVFDAFTTGPVLDQILRIAEEGRKNLAPLATIVIRLGRSFLNIAEAGGPALKLLLDFVSDLARQFENLTKDTSGLEKFFITGEEHFEAWIKLGLSVLELMFALGGAGGAETGILLVEDATKAINGLIDDINSNKGAVGDFFADSREVIHEVVGIIVALAIELERVFTPDRIAAFADLVKTVFIPALGDAITLLGNITNFLLEVSDTPLGKQLLQLGVAAFLVSKIFASAAGVFSGFIKLFAPLGKHIGTAAKALEPLGKAILNLAGRVPGVSRIATILSRLSLLRFAAFGGAIGIIVLLLEKLGLLDEVWDEIVQAFGAFWGQVQPPLERFVASFQDLWDAISAGEGAFAALEPVLRILIKVGGFLLESIFKAIGQVLGGLIDIIGGLMDIVTGILTGDFGKVWEGIKDIFRGAANAIIGILTLVFFRGLGGLFRGIINIFKSIGKGILDVIITAGRNIAFNFIQIVERVVPAVLRFLGRLPRAIFEIARDIVRFFGRGFSAVGRTIRNVIDDVWGWLRRLPGRFLDLARDIVQRFWRGFQRIGRVIREAIEDAWGFLRRLPGRIFDLAKDLVIRFWRGYRTIGSYIRKGIEDVWGWIKGLPERLGNVAKDAVKAFANAFKDLGNFLKDAIAGGTRGATTLAKNVVNAIFNLINKGWNEFLGGKEFGVGPLKFTVPRLNIKLAKGGPVPGAGRGDKVSAMLEPGEHIWTAEEVKRAGGHAAMFALRRVLGGGGQSTGGGYQRGGAAREGAAAGSLTIEFKGGKLDDFASAWRHFWNTLVVITRRSVNLIEKLFRDLRVETGRSMDRMYRDVRETLGDIEAAYRNRGKRISNTWTDMWDSLKKSTHEALNYIGHETNQALKGLGEDVIHFGFTEPKKGDKKASGGFIGGQGHRGRDRYHTVLGAGEAVLNWQHQAYLSPAVQAYYGHSLAETFDRVHGYHAGGPEQRGMASGGMVHIPGQPASETIHRSIVNDVVKLARQYKLLVTDGYAPTGHAASGEHPKGLAIDAVPGPGGSWGLIDKLARWAEPVQDQPRKPFRWVGYTGDPNHGSGNHIHLSWDGINNIDGLADLVTNVLRPVLTGPKGGLLTLAQSAVDKVRKVANKVLDEKSMAVPEGYEDSKYPKGVLSQSQVEQTIRQALKILDITSNVAMWVQTLTRQASRESGFNPNAVNNWDINAQRGDPSKGLIQIIGSNFARYKVAGHDNIFNPLSNILAVIKYTIDRYGGGDADRGVQTLWGRGGGAYAKGGEIPGAPGSPVPILAHAREWVLNETQQNRIARMLGMNREALKRLIGFAGGNRGRRAFQVGGEVEEGAPGSEALNLRYTSEYARRRISRLRRGLYELPILPLFSWESVVREARRAFLAISRRGRALSVQVADLNEQIKELEKGDETKAEKEKIKKLKAERKALIEGGTMVKEIAAVNKEIEKLQKGDEDRAQLREIAKLVRERRQLQRRGRREVAVQARLQALRALTTEGGIIDQMDQARERFSATLTRRLTFATFKFNRATRRVRQRMDEGDIAAREVENARRELRRVIGEEGVITKALKKTNARLKTLRRGGVTEEEAPELRDLETVRANLRERRGTIRDAHAQALERVFQAQLDRQTKVVDEINNRAEASTATNELQRRFGEAIGDEGLIAKTVGAQRDILTTQANELERRIAAAKRIGATDLANQLTAQVADLRMQIFESIQQELRDAAERINARAQRRLGRIDLGGRMLDAIGAVGLGSVASVAGEQFSRGGMYGMRAQTLAQQRAELQGVLGGAMAQGNIGLIQELTDQLAELDVTIQENTKAYFDARVEDVNARAGFGLQINDLTKRLYELKDTAAGQIDQARLLTLAQERSTILTQQGNELRALLLEAQQTGNQQAMNDLQVALLENEIALLENTQAIDEMNGVMKEPQTFTSSAWTWFREAIFTGMGQVLPQYDPTNMGNVVTGAGIYPAVTNSSSRVSGDTNINLYEAGRPVDLEEVSSVVTFASKTAQ